MVEYWKGRLSADGQQAYAACHAAVTGGNFKVKFPEIPQKEISDVFTALVDDHPELFYIGNGLNVAVQPVFGRTRRNVTMQFEQLYSESESRRIAEELSKLASSFRQYARSEEEAERKICEHLVRTVEYQINNTYNQNAASALYFKKAQCSGFAKGVKYLLDSLGIWCIVVNGMGRVQSGQTIPHSWNIVRINGKYYHLDSTFLKGANQNNSSQTIFMYYNCADAAFADTHKWDRSTVPACTDNTYDGGATGDEALRRHVFGEARRLKIEKAATDQGAERISSLYEFKQLLKRSTNGRATFVYQCGLSLARQQTMLMETAQNYCRENGISAHISLSSRSGVWEVKIEKRG